MTMKIVSRTEICQIAPERWAEQYRNTRHTIHAERTVRLSLLSPQDRTPEKIDAIIGNPSWTTNCCDECGVNQEILVRLGEEPDYGSRYLDLCLNCLRAAVALAEQNAPKP